MAGMVAASEPSLASLAPNGPSGSTLSTIMASTSGDSTAEGERYSSRPAIMRCPDFMDSHDSGVFIHAHIGHLRRVRICWRGADACAFERSSTGFFRRGVRAGPAESAAEINGGNNGLLKTHVVLRPFFLALLLKRSAQNLAFHAATDFLDIAGSRIHL